MTHYVAHVTANRCSWLPRLQINSHSEGFAHQQVSTGLVWEVASGLQVAAALAIAERVLPMITDTESVTIECGESNVRRRCREIECDTCHGGE